MINTKTLNLCALVALLLSVATLQPANADAPVAPCKASAVTLYSTDRAAYSGKSKEYIIYNRYIIKTR